MLTTTHLVGFGGGGEPGIGGNDANTVLLLHADGSDASTTFTDSSSYGHTVTASGNAQIDTAQSKFGGASMLFDGSGDYLLLDGSADFSFGTGDFTVDFWVRFSSLSGTPMLYDSRAAGGSSQPDPTIFVNSSKILLYVSGATRITGATTLSTNTWYHVALSRSSGTSRLFVNGTVDGTWASDTTNYENSPSRPVIGAAGDNLGVGYLNGWIDEYRVSKGVARWTADFTPPTGPYD